MKIVIDPMSGYHLKESNVKFPLKNDRSTFFETAEASE